MILGISGLTQLSGAPPFVVPSGCTLWVEGDTLSASDGDPVSTWSDQSGNGNDATQSGGRRPIYKTGIINGLPVVRFDGVDDFLSFSSIGVGTSTTFIVGRINTISTDQDPLATFIITPDMRLVSRTLSGTNWGTYVIPDLNSGEDLSINTPVLLEATGAVFDTKLYRSGVLKATSGNTMLGGASGRIGSEDDTRRLNGDIAAILQFNVVLSTGERQRTEDYLTDKYLP